MRPPKGTYPDYYENYIPLVKQDSVLTALQENEKEVIAFFTSISADLENYAYGPGKWSLKQILNHCIDTERVFAYRALRFARKDEKQPLPFDQDDYVANAEVEKRTLRNLIAEFESVRRASISLFDSFNDETLARSGNTAAGRASVNAIGFTICGHYLHHMTVISERYLKK